MANCLQTCGDCSGNKKAQHISAPGLSYSGAGERVRTVDLNLGKVALYQLSYARIYSASANPILRFAGPVLAALFRRGAEILALVRSLSR